MTGTTGARPVPSLQTSAANPLSWYWIPITIGAALSQNIRTALQKSLKGRLSTNAANFTRYVYGLPFAIV